MIYKPKYFELYELVPKDIYDSFDHNYLWQRFNRKLLQALDMLREKFGECIINDWFWGGEFEYSGYRPLDWYDKPRLSLHCFFRAFDLKFKNVSAVEVRRYIKKNESLYSNYINGIEGGVDWVHIDDRNFDGIEYFGKETK